MQQQKTNMINEEWEKTQNNAPFVALYDMHAVTFVLPDEMANVSISGLQWFIIITQLNHTGSHRPIDSHSKPYLHREKNALDPLGFFSWECPRARHFRAQPSTGETQESMNNVSCRRDMTEILLKAA